MVHSCTSRRKVMTKYFKIETRPSEEEITQFTSKAPVKTPPMNVTISQIKWDGSDQLRGDGFFEAPAGFQLDRYVAKLHPDRTVHVAFGSDSAPIGLKYNAIIVNA